MDRVIAFGAGAVLAFFLGYLVSYQMNGPDSEGKLSKARQELEEGLSTGLIDAETPKLKSLPDLANQNSESLTADLSAAEINDLKVLLLPHLTVADLAGWQAARQAHIAKFLTIGTGPWAVGSDESASPRFDAALAHAAEGRYQGKISLLQGQQDSTQSLDLVVELKNFDRASPEGRIAFHKGDGTPMWGVQFRWRYVGTDAETRSLYLVVPPFGPEAAANVSHLALTLPVDMDVGKATSGELLGLNQDLVWVRVGSFEMLKSE